MNNKHHEPSHDQRITEEWYMTIITEDDRRIESVPDWRFKSKLQAIVFRKRHAEKLRNEYKVKEFRFSRVVTIFDDDLIIMSEQQNPASKQHKERNEN